MSAGQGAHSLTGKLVPIVSHAEFVPQQTATMEQGPYVKFAKAKGRKEALGRVVRKKSPHLSPPKERQVALLSAMRPEHGRGLPKSAKAKI